MTETDKNEVKQMVLNSLEHLFTDLTEKYNSQENHDMVLYLMDVENRVKQSLMDPVLT
jgi:hypothetical protein